MIEVVAAIVQTATPLVLATLGGVFAARAGIWHLGLGGLISIGAVVSVVATNLTGSIWLGLLLAVLASVLISVVMWCAIALLSANAIIVGIGVNSLGYGASVLTVVALFGSEQTVYAPGGLAKAFPGAAGSVGQLSVLAVATPLIVLAAWFMLRRTRFGLRVFAVGDHPFAARSAGISRTRVQLSVLVIGGVLCALAGIELALGSLQSFSAGMEGGRGLIAFAAVILGASQPIRSTVSAVAFGAITYFAIAAQINFSGVVPVEFMLMLPYIAAIIGVVATSGRRGITAGFNTREVRDS